MSKSELHAFIDRARSDEAFRKQLKELNPQEIINFAAKSGFDFSDEIKGDSSTAGKEFISVLKPLK